MSNRIACIQSPMTGSCGVVNLTQFRILGDTEELPSNDWSSARKEVEFGRVIGSSNQNLAYACFTSLKRYPCEEAYKRLATKFRILFQSGVYENPVHGNDPDHKGFFVCLYSTKEKPAPDFKPNWPF